MIANDVFRGRFRKSFENPEPIQPDRVEEYTIDLHWNDHCFKKGHKIMVQIQSTWFPLIDRNPQTFVPNIFKAEDKDFRPATQRIFRSPGHATYMELNLIKRMIFKFRVHPACRPCLRYRAGVWPTLLRKTCAR